MSSVNSFAGLARQMESMSNTTSQVHFATSTSGREKREESPLSEVAELKKMLGEMSKKLANLTEKKPSQRSNLESYNPKNRIECHYCHKLGHLHRDCFTKMRDEGKEIPNFARRRRAEFARTYERRDNRRHNPSDRGRSPFRRIDRTRPKERDQRDPTPPVSNRSRDSTPGSNESGEEESKDDPKKFPKYLDRRSRKSKEEQEEENFVGILTTRKPVVRAPPVGNFVRSYVELNGHQYDCLFDTGANFSIMTKRVVKECFLKIEEDEHLDPKTVDLKDVESLGTTDAEIEIKLASSEMITVFTSFEVVTKLPSCDFLIGQNIINAVGITIENGKAFCRKHN